MIEEEPIREQMTPAVHKALPDPGQSPAPRPPAQMPPQLIKHVETDEEPPVSTDS